MAQLFNTLRKDIPKVIERRRSRATFRRKLVFGKVGSQVRIAFVVARSTDTVIISSIWQIYTLINVVVHFSVIFQYQGSAVVDRAKLKPFAVRSIDS